MNEDRDRQRATDASTGVDAVDEEGFLSRWSRRKSLSRDGIELPEPEPDDGTVLAPAPDGETPPAESAADRDLAVDEPQPELPPLESLDADSDYSAFLNARVPEDLRKKALHKLFHSPKFNVRDGLDDYDLDFSKPEPLGEIITAEMRHRIRVELERLAEREVGRDAPEDSPAQTIAESDVTGDTAITTESEPDDDRTEPS